MAVEAACPQGVVACNDVTAINLMVPLFPIAVLVAFALAWPAARLVPRHPLVGWPLAIVGAAGYLLFAAGPIIPVATAFVLLVSGIALVIGRREPRTAQRRLS